ncbi:SagB/ThcOx family dehydrogenase [Tumidithrix elongata RA019]|uniref:SagB/ThcOx family dehydrogenase n=1 Tax=Tumidithrix elongata BACA0141 TaxID=2716417 RepID=A0AAW9PVB6_9CYAN|nr:SagB/ThcOx family dehydrogenase [Tumidithrix elongata RA019]
MSEQPMSIAEHYHERTKYDPETISAKNQGLDWSTQPSPYKEYKFGTVYDLKVFLTEPIQSDMDGLLVSRWQRLSRLLLCSYGLTARVPTMTGEPLYLRSAPSAGGLYPAEIYIISGGTALLPAGLYNYQPRNHILIQFWSDRHVWQTLQEACFSHPALSQTRIAIATTAVFFRSAWRYQDRAYRRIFLDTGHLLGNIKLAAALNDFRAHFIGGFKDEVLNQLLYLDNAQEGAIAVIPIVDLQDEELIARGQEARGTKPTQAISNRRDAKNASHNDKDRHEDNPPFAGFSLTALPSNTQRDFPYVPDGELLGYFHQATQISSDRGLSDREPNGKSQGASFQERDTKTASTDGDEVSPRTDKYNFPFCTKVGMETEPIHWGDELEDLESTILRRRSTREYSGTALELAELKAVLDFTYQPQHYADQGLYDPVENNSTYFDLSLIETFIAVSSVTGLEEGCYYYAPHSQELRQIRFKNFRRELHYLCLGQDLGRTAGAVLFHTADLKQAVKKYGDRAYRYLHMDAGHLGQRLNLAAIQLGLGVSGIGGFFDNQVNEVLGIPSDEAVLYITTLGRPR